MYCGFITTLKNVRPHPNADKLQLADCFINTVCVGLAAKENDVVIYFPTDGQLSVEYCAQNDLVRRKDENGNPAGGYLDPNKRNVKAIRLRGEKSDGITMPLESLTYTGVDLSTLTIGTQITVVNGHEICTKYIPKSNSNSHYVGGNKARKKKAPVAPLFAEHADTEQLAYNLASFYAGDEIEITLKMHGTSQRTGYLPILTGYKDTVPCRAGNAIRHMLNKLDGGHREDIHNGEPIYDWGYVSGTRRVVLDSYEGGFYGDNEFREQHSKAFEGKLMKGETVYYEVVGFTTSGQPIMGDASNKKLNDKEFIKQYGETTRFSYGCSPNLYYDSTSGEVRPYATPQSDIYVYRMTMTNEDGFVVEYTPDYMRYRCEQMGIKTVPVFAKGHIKETHDGFPFIDYYNAITNSNSSVCRGDNFGECVKYVAEQFYDGPDPVGKTHVREGVVVRIINRPKFTAYKHKNFSFKVLEGIIKESAEAPDMEEAQELSEEVDA